MVRDYFIMREKLEESRAGIRINGDQFDLSVKRFKVALEAVKLMGISDKAEARRIANEITKETTDVDLVGFILPYCSPDSVQKLVAAPSPADRGEEDGILNSFVSAWWEEHREDAVPSRQLHQLITDKKIPLNLGTGSKRCRSWTVSRSEITASSVRVKVRAS